MTDLYQAILDPSKYAGGLVVDSGAPLMHKDVSIYGVFKPGSDAPVNGFLIWNVFRGYNSVTIATAPSVITDLTWYGNSQGLVTWTPTLLDTKTPCPTNKQLTISPELEKTISMGRLAVGLIKVYSATTSTTVAALNGQLCGGSVTDLRNLTDWSPPDITQNSCTTKDAISNVKASEGIVSILGPDIRDNLRAINANGTVTYGSAARFSVQAPANASFVVDGAAGTYGGLWLSSRCTGPQYGYNYTCPLPFIPWGTSIVVTPSLYFSVTQAPVVGSTVTFAVTVVMGRSTSNGAIIPTRYISQTSVCNASANQQPATFSGSPCVFSLSQYGGVYAEEIIGIQIGAVQMNPAQVGTIPSIIWNDTEIQILDAYDLDTIGNHRIISWNNITTNQTLNIDGKFQVDGVPTGAIAPYVKSSAAVGMGDANFLYTLRAVFAEPQSLLKRIYSWQDYLNARDSRGQEHSVVNHAALSAAGMYGMAGSYASRYKSDGLFTDIGSGLGRMAGSAIDDILTMGGQYRDEKPRKKSRVEDVRF